MGQLTTFSVLVDHLTRSVKFMSNGLQIMVDQYHISRRSEIILLWLMPNSSNYWSQSIEQQGSLSINPRTTLPHLGQIFLGRASTIQMRPIGRLRLEFKTTLNPLTFPLKLHTTRRPKSQSHFIHLLQLLNEGSVRRFQRSFSAYLSILSEASTDTTSNPSSSNIMESTLKCIFLY